MCFVTFGPIKQFKFESNEVFFYMYSFFSWINIRKHLQMNLKIMKRDRKQQIVSHVQRKLNWIVDIFQTSLCFRHVGRRERWCLLWSNRWPPGFEGLPLSSLAYQKDGTKELVDPFFSTHLTAEEVKVRWCWSTGWDFAFAFIPERLLCGQRETRQMLLI